MLFRRLLSHYRIDLYSLPFGPNILKCRIWINLRIFSRPGVPQWLHSQRIGHFLTAFFIAEFTGYYLFNGFLTFVGFWPLVYKLDFI